jgi:biopolymer transport protein ExbD
MRLPQQPPKKGRIEIIPMIDAIFFLLVFFIMTSLSMIQMDTHGAQLPASRSGLDRPPTNRIVVALRKDNALFVDRDPATEAEMKTRVAAAVGANPNVTVLLSVDKGGDVSRFLRVFDLVKQTDAANVVIATEPVKQ